MAAVTRVICEAQWQAANIKVFISFLQFTIYSARLTSQLPFSTTTKNQLFVRVKAVSVEDVLENIAQVSGVWVADQAGEIMPDIQRYSASIMNYIMCTTIRLLGLFE